MPVSQRTALVLLRVDRKRRFGHQQQSRGILFCEFFFLFSFLAQRERVLIDGNCASNDMQISRSRWQDSCLVVWSSCNRGVAGRSQTTSRPATTVSGNSILVNYFFLFSFLAQREHVSVVADCAWTDMRIRRSRWQDLCPVIRGCYDRDASLATICACRAARRSQTTSRPATTVSGNSFS